MVLSEIRKLVSDYVRDRDSVKFGTGNKQDELRNCDDIAVFMVCEGYTGTEKVKKDFPKNFSVLQARDGFGRPMRQQRIKDEHGYVVDEERQLWELSNQCKLKLHFCYDVASEQEEAWRLAKGGATVAVEQSRQGLEAVTRVAKERVPAVVETSQQKLEETARLAKERAPGVAEKGQQGFETLKRWLGSDDSGK